MADIVERLRGQQVHRDICREAADEIDRLRKDNIAIVLSAQANDEQATALLKQNAELLAALERVIDGRAGDRDMARAAIERAKQ